MKFVISLLAKYLGMGGAAAAAIPTIEIVLAAVEEVLKDVEVVAAQHQAAANGKQSAIDKLAQDINQHKQQIDTAITVADKLRALLA
jgi:uncharacterized membrane protein YtjA (UPF0391 family)